MQAVFLFIKYIFLKQCLCCFTYHLTECRVRAYELRASPRDTQKSRFAYLKIYYAKMLKKYLYAYKYKYDASGDLSLLLEASSENAAYLDSCG